MEALRRVCRGRAVIATAYYPEPLLRVYETAVNLGLRLTRRKTRIRYGALIHNASDDTYWVPTPTAASAGPTPSSTRASDRCVGESANCELATATPRRYTAGPCRP